MTDKAEPIRLTRAKADAKKFAWSIDHFEIDGAEETPKSEQTHNQGRYVMKNGKLVPIQSA